VIILANRIDTHVPNTSEPSTPHESRDEPQRHVDWQHFDEKGEHNTKLDRQQQSHHDTSPSSIEWGEQLDQARKDGKYPPKK
jgi:hypothetical protein